MNQVIDNLINEVIAKIRDCEDMTAEQAKRLQQPAMRDRLHHRIKITDIDALKALCTNKASKEIVYIQLTILNCLFSLSGDERVQQYAKELWDSHDLNLGFSSKVTVGFCMIGDGKLEDKYREEFFDYISDHWAQWLAHVRGYVRGEHEVREDAKKSDYTVLKHAEESLQKCNTPPPPQALLPSPTMLGVFMQPGSSRRNAPRCRPAVG